MDFASNQFGIDMTRGRGTQIATGPVVPPASDFSDVPPPRPRRKPRKFSGTTYSSTIAPFDNSMWRAGMPRFGGGVQAIPAGESANARRERRQRAKGQLFSFPLYATPPTGSRLNFSKLRDLREGRISDETLKNARYFSEVLGAGAYARNYDFYISTVAKAVFDLTNSGPYATTMRNRYWQPFSRSVYMERFRSTRPVLEAGGESGPQNIRDDVNLFWQLTANSPTGNRGQAFQILRSLAKQIFKGQVDYRLTVHQGNNPSNAGASLSVSPEFWFATKNSNVRAALLDKMPYGEINVTLDSGSQLRMPILRALRLLSGAAWLSNSPSAQTQAVLREYDDYMARDAVAATLNPFQFQVQDWGTTISQPNALMDIVYFYGYWSYIKARSRDTGYWRRAFEEEILHPTACQLPRQRFYEGFLPEITFESNLTAATRNDWTLEFEDYCESLGLPVPPVDRISRGGSTQGGSPIGFDFGGAGGGGDFGFDAGALGLGAGGGGNFGFDAGALGLGVGGGGSGDVSVGAGGGGDFGFDAGGLGSGVGGGGSGDVSVGAGGSGDVSVGAGGVIGGEGAAEETLPAPAPPPFPAPPPEEAAPLSTPIPPPRSARVPPPPTSTPAPDEALDVEPAPDDALALEPMPEKKKLSTGQIAGIAAGSVAAAAGLLYLLRK